MNGKIGILAETETIKIKYLKLKITGCFNDRMEITKENVRKCENKSKDIIQSKEKEKWGSGGVFK